MDYHYHDDYDDNDDDDNDNHNDCKRAAIIINIIIICFVDATGLLRFLFWFFLLDKCFLSEGINDTLPILCEEANRSDCFRILSSVKSNNIEILFEVKNARFITGSVEFAQCEELRVIATR